MVTGVVPHVGGPILPPGCPTVLIGNMPALNNTSKLMCTWGEAIQVVNPGQTTVLIP